MPPKLIYQAYSFFEFIRTLFFRFVCVCAFVYSVVHFEENPVVVSIFACLCIFFVFILGEDQIKVYSDRVVHSTNSLASLIFRRKGNVYRIEEIKTAYLPLPEKGPDVFEVGVIAVLLAITPKRSSSNQTRPILLETKAGKTLQIDTYLSFEQREKVVEAINSLIR